MKKLVILLGLLFAIQMTAQAQTKFTALDFSNSSNTNVASAPTPNMVSTTALSSADTPKGTDMLDPNQVTGGVKMQSAIYQLETAEVEVRNKLLNYKNSFAEVDARYNTVKAQRKELKKQISLAEKKIRNIEKAKKKIQKNFERKINV